MMKNLLVLLALFALLFVGACGRQEDDPKKPEGSAGEQTQPKSIGSATMKDDGTIVLTLRAEDPKTGTTGDGRFEYPRGHAEYDKVLKHVGGLKPGEEKPVPPWPE